MFKKVKMAPRWPCLAEQKAAAWRRVNNEQQKGGFLGDRRTVIAGESRRCRRFSLTLRARLYYLISGRQQARLEHARLKFLNMFWEILRDCSQVIGTVSVALVLSAPP